MREQIGRLVHQDEHDDRRGCDHRGEAAVAHFHAHALLPVLIVHCRPSCSDAPICSIFGQCACSGPISSIISSCSAGALATSCLYSVGDIPGSLRTNATMSQISGSGCVLPHAGIAVILMPCLMIQNC